MKNDTHRQYRGEQDEMSVILEFPKQEQAREKEALKEDVKTLLSCLLQEHSTSRGGQD